MSQEYTSTNKYEGPGLNVDALRQMWEQLKVDLYYRVSEFVPKVNADGNPFCISVPDRPLGFNDPPVALRDVQIVYIHPDNLPWFLHIAGQKGLRVAPKDT